MKKYFISIVLCLLLFIPNVVLAAEDYSKTTGDFNIFSIGDDHATIMDKIQYLEDNHLLVSRGNEKDNKLFICFYIVKDISLDISLDFTSSGDTKILSSICVFYPCALSLARTIVKDLSKDYSESGVLVKFDSQYFSEMTNKTDDSVIIGWWKKDGIAIVLAGRYNRDTNKALIMNIFTSDSAFLEVEE